MTPPTIRSRKVRRILALEARARRLLTRYERARDKAVRARIEVHRVLDQAQLLEITLTGGELGELHRGRSALGQRPAPPNGGADCRAGRPTTLP